MILTTPAVLFAGALDLFIVGLALYLGPWKNSNPDPPLRSMRSFDIYFFYIGSLTFAIAYHYLPITLKSAESIIFGVIGSTRLARHTDSRETGLNNDLAPSDIDGNTVDHELVHLVPGRLSPSSSVHVAVQHPGQLPSAPTATPKPELRMEELRAALSSYIAAQEESVRPGKAFLEAFSQEVRDIPSPE